jgi:hypothetical protein
MLMAAAALALAACGQQSGSGPALPAPQSGVQAPSTLTPPANPAQRAQITDEVRAQLIGNITDLLNQAQSTFASGMAVPGGFVDEVAPMEPS